jgi:hypothetical protein
VTPLITMRAALEDDQLLGRALPGPSWRNWRVLLISMMGEPLDDEERIIFRELTGREQEPLQKVEEFVAIIGRRGGKSRADAVLMAYLVGCCRYDELVPGERGIAMIVSADKEQSQIVLSYVEAALKNSPMLKQLVSSVTANQIRLTNNLTVAVRAGDYRRVRGTTLIAAIGDECAHWFSIEGGINPDTEVVAAMRPALATTGGLLALISSPYAKRGELYSLYKKHFGADGDPLILVAKASSGTMNPSLPTSVVNRAYARDPISAAAEFGAEFRSDVSNFVDREIIDACVAKGMFERLPAVNVGYTSFVDPSGGSSDSFTCAIGHRDASNSMIYVDCLREIRAPFSPQVAVAELSVLLKSYRVGKVFGDHYAGLWPAEAFSKHGISYEGSVLPKSQLYSNFLPLLNSGMVELVDSQRLINQLAALERKTARGGKDSIDHPSSGHDDCANAVAGFAVHANNSSANYDALIEMAFGNDNEAAPVNPRPKRAHPNLEPDQLARISAPVQMVPWEVINHHQRRMVVEREMLAKILAERVNK